MMRAKFKELGRESLIYGVSGMLNKFIAVFLVPVYTSVFSKEEFGTMGLLTTVITLASALTVMGLDSATHAWYWQSEDETDRRSTVATWFWCQLAVSLATGCLLGLFAGPVSGLLSENSASAGLLALAAITLPLGVCHGVITNYFRLRRMALATMWYTIASNLLLVGLTVLFVLGLKMGLPGFFKAQIACGLCTTVAGLMILGRWISPRLANPQRLREMLRYGLPLLPAAIAFWIVGLADRIFIEKMESTSAVGSYQLAATIASAVAMVTGAFTLAWGPFSLSLQKQEGSPALYARVMPVYLAVGGMMVIGVSLFSREVILLVAQKSYLDAAGVSAVLCLGALANGLSYVAGTGLTLARKSTPVTAAVSIAAAVNIGLNFVLIPPFGIMGAAWAAGISWLVYSAYIYWHAQQAHRIPYPVARVAVIILLLLAAVITGPRLQIESLPVALLVKSTAACALLCLLFTIAHPGWHHQLRRLIRA